MSDIKKCLFCDNEVAYKGCGPLDSQYYVECPNCGVYFTSDTIAEHDADVLKSFESNKHLISGVIREKNELGLQVETITTNNITILANDALIPKTIMQKLDKILLHFYRQSNEYGKQFSIDDKTPYAIGYAVNFQELFNMVQALIDYGIFTAIMKGGTYKTFTISIKGLNRAEEILSTNTYSNKVFVAMGFKDDLLEAHRSAIQPACKECGFEAFLVIEREHNGDITDKIISEIKMSKFVITDFTYNNQGAYFEAGYAQGRGLEVIRTCKKEWFDGVDESGDKNRLHFDVNHYNFILWENYDDLKEKLVNRIRATIL